VKQSYKNMFGSNYLSGNASSRLSVIEPHVRYYDIGRHERGELVFPFQLMAFTLLGFVAIGLFDVLFRGDSQMVLVVFWLYCIFSPFYFPGVYHFYHYFKRERQKTIELDFKHQLITYEDRHKGSKLHFSVSSISSCVIYHSQMFPYGIDYLKITLDNGTHIIISSLLISPWRFLEELEVDYEVEKRVFNSLPDH